MVANGVRETLTQLYAAAANVQVFEPVIPSPQSWETITRDAMLFRIRGAATDVVVVLRPRDALALTAFAFGEVSSQLRPLSPIESTVLERAVRAIAATCTAICGISSDVLTIERVFTIAGFASFFELQLVRPVEARIGFALAKEPIHQAQAQLRIEDLLDIQVELSLHSEAVDGLTADLASLELGAIVPITKDRGMRGALLLAGTPLARGECGVQDGRFALAIGASTNDERSLETAS